MAADGSDVRRLTYDAAEDTNPNWSQQDSHILFTSDRGGNVDVYVMASDGADIQNLTQDPEWDWVPDWTP